MRRYGIISSCCGVTPRRRAYSAVKDAGCLPRSIVPPSCRHLTHFPLQSSCPIAIGGTLLPLAGELSPGFVRPGCRPRSSSQARGKAGVGRSSRSSRDSKTDRIRMVEGRGPARRTGVQSFIQAPFIRNLKCRQNACLKEHPSLRFFRLRAALFMCVPVGRGAAVNRRANMWIATRPNDFEAPNRTTGRRS